MQELDLARRAGARQTWQARANNVLRLGAALDAVAVVYATGRLTEVAYWETRARILPRSAVGGTPPGRWGGPSDVQAYLEARRQELLAARAALELPLAQARKAGSALAARSAYANLVLTLGAAMDSVAGAYCAWYIDVDQYLRRRLELMRAYARESVLTLSDLRG